MRDTEFNAVLRHAYIGTREDPDLRAFATKRGFDLDATFPEKLEWEYYARPKSDQNKNRRDKRIFFNMNTRFRLVRETTFGADSLTGKITIWVAGNTGMIEKGSFWMLTAGLNNEVYKQHFYAEEGYISFADLKTEPSSAKSEGP